ncbi:Titin, partial [Frankliniella fusca]
RPGLAHAVPIHDQQARGAGLNKDLPGGSQRGTGASGGIDGVGGPQVSQPAGQQPGFQQLAGWTGPQSFFTPQQGVPARLPQQGFVAPQQRFMMPHQQGIPQHYAPQQHGFYGQDIQGPQVAYAKTFIPHKNLPRPGFAALQQVAHPIFRGPHDVPEVGSMDEIPPRSNLPFASTHQFQSPQSPLEPEGGVQQPSQPASGYIQMQPQGSVMGATSLAPASNAHDNSFLAPSEVREETPWRRPRSSSVQAPRKVPSPWAPASRDRSLDSQQTTSEKAQPWTKQNVKLKKAPRPKKSFEKEQLQPVQLKPSMIERKPIPREELEHVDLKPGQRVAKQTPDREGIHLRPVLDRERDLDTPADKQLKPNKRQSRPRTRSGEEKRQPPAEETFPKPDFKGLDDDEHSLDRSLDGSLDRSIDESLDDDFWKPKVAPWSSEPVVLKKTQRKRKVFKKEELEEVHLKPAKIEKKRLSKPELEHVDLKPVPQEQLGILSWTEEEEASLLKIDREEIENYKQRPRSRSRDLLSEASEASDVKSVSEPVPWSQESLHLKKAPRLPKKEFPKETLEEVQLKPAVIERRQMAREELEHVELHHVEKDGIGSWAEEDDSSMLKLDLEEIESYKRRPRSRSRDLLDETSEADDTSMSLDLSLEDRLDNRKGPVPWTEEPIQLKRTPREHKEVPKETVEQVHLKPSKIERKEVPKEQLEHVDLKPAEKIPKEAPTPDHVILKPIPKPSRGAVQDQTMLQPYSETDDASLLSLNRKVDETETKKPRPDFLEMVRSQDTDHTDVPFFWKRGGPIPDEVEIRHVQGEDTTVRELERTIRRLKEEETKEQFSETEDTAKLAIEATSEESKIQKRSVPLGDDKPQPVPWTQQSIHLRTAPREKREIPKETLPGVSLKPTQIVSRPTSKESVEYVSLKPVSKDSRESGHPQNATLTEVERSILGFVETDDSNLLRYEQLEETDTVKSKEIGVTWERGTKKQKRQTSTEMEDSSVLHGKREDTSTKVLKETAANLQRREKMDSLEKRSETDDSSFLSVDKKEEKEFGRSDEVPVMWQRGKKKVSTVELLETEDSTFLSVGQQEKIVEKHPEEKPVMWQRGKKKTETVEEPHKIAIDVPVIEGDAKENAEKQPEKPRPVSERQPEPVPWNQQHVQLRKTTRERKELKKETIEEVALKPSKTIRHEIPKDRVEHVDLTPVQLQSMEDRGPENIKLKAVDKVEVVEESRIAKDEIRRKAPEKDLSVQYSDVEDSSYLSLRNKEDVSKQQKEKPVSWRRQKIPTERNEIEQITEVDDATRLGISKQEDKSLVTEVPIMWERGKKKPKLADQPKAENEDVAVLKVDKTVTEDGIRKPHTSIPANDSKEIPWNREDVKLKKTPKRIVGEPIPTVEEVKLKPTKKQSSTEDVSLTSPVVPLDVQSEDLADALLEPKGRNGRPLTEGKDVPWTQEKIQLKRTPRPSQEPSKAPGEEVQLKPVTKRVDTPERVSLDTGIVLDSQPTDTDGTTETSSETGLPWRRSGQLKKPEEIPEEVRINRAPRRPKEPEEEKPEIQLRPAKQKPKELTDQPEVTLKPWKRGPLDSVIQEDIQTHPHSRKEVSVPPGNQIQLAPVEKLPSEDVTKLPLDTEIKEMPKPHIEDIVKTHPTEAQIPPQRPKEATDQKPVPLKRTSEQRLKSDEEKEVVQLKPVRRGVKSEETNDSVDLKQITKKTTRKSPEKRSPSPVEKVVIATEKREGVKLKSTKRVTIKEPAEEIQEFDEASAAMPLEVPQNNLQEPTAVLEKTHRLKSKSLLPKEEDQKPETVTLKPTKRGPKIKQPAADDIKLKPIPRRDAAGLEKEPLPLKPLTAEQNQSAKPVAEEQYEMPGSTPLEESPNKAEEGEVLKAGEDMPETVKKPSKPAVVRDVPVASEVPKDETKPSWRRKRIRIPKPVPGRPADEQPVVDKTELITEQVIEDSVEDVPEEARSETMITLATQKTSVTKTSLVPKEALDKEEQPIWQKQMSVETQSRRVTRRAGQFIQEETPLRDLEIVTAKRGVDKLPEEPVVEEEVREDRTTVRRSIVQRSTAEILAPQKAKPPKFIKRLEPVATSPESPSKFTCQVEGVPFPELTWLYNGKQLRATELVSMTVVDNVVTLEIAKTLPQHVGVYSCKATNPAGVAMSTANLVILEKEESGVAPQFSQPLKPQVVKPREAAILRCHVKGEPTPIVRWYRGDTEVKADNTRSLSYDSVAGIATLTILEPTPEDEVIYRVVATNKFGKAECRANLILGEQVSVSKPEILHAPRITEPLKAVLAVKGQPVVMAAEFQGTPQPEVRWYRNGKEIVPSAESDKEIVTESFRTELRIPAITKQHSGKYEVRAMNPAGEARTSGSVAVRDHDADDLKDARAPRFIEPLEPQIVSEGECVVLEARVDSFPTCSFQWLLHSVPVKSSPEFRVVTEENRSVLVVREVLPEHAGDYTCRAENAVGSVTSTATLSVVPEMEWETTPELEIMSPQFVKPVTSLKVMDGEKVTFTCQVLGKPTPRVTWRHNGQPIKEAKDVIIYQDQEGLCKLAISEVFPEDAGLYTCEALNRVGEAVCSASLIVEAYEYVPDSEIASVAVDTNLATAKSISEEDLLEKESLSSIEDHEMQAAHFVTPLVHSTPSREGELVRLEVKAAGNPRPVVRWYKQGSEILPTKDFQIENYEDGTSVLTIMEVFPDDVGEITCEAQNELGVDQTVTELEVHGILGTKEYRKPEWVTQMEELKDALKAVQAVPSIEVEIRDAYVEELDTVVFECVYSGTPKPDIIWYHDDQIVRNTEKVRITIEEGKTTCTVNYTSPEDAGIYVCKATSDIGMAITKAKLSVTELPEDRKEEKTLNLAKQEEEKIKLEKVKMEKKREKKKRRPRWGITDERDHASTEEVQTLETLTQFSQTVDSAFAQRRQSIQDSVAVSAVASCKKVDEPEKPNKRKDTAQQVVCPREGIAVSEMQPTHEVEDLPDDKKPKTRKAKTADIEGLKDAKITVIKVHEIIKKQKLKMAKEIEDIMELVNAREFGPGESPLRELAQIGFLVRHGVSVSDITSVYHETDEFPALRTPAAQSALVSLVEREGHGTLISQVLTEETTADETTVAKTVGFRAFMRMIELCHVTVEEVLTHFNPEDFHMPVWETSEATKVETSQLKTVNVSRRTEVVTENKMVTKTRSALIEDETEETLEEVETQTGRATQEHTPHSRDEGVTILELNEDDTSVAETDTAIITQPDDDYKYTEEQQNVREHSKQDNEKTEKRKKVVIKEKTEETKDEIEINVEIIEGKKRKITKTLRAQMPDESDEYIDEDFTGTLSKDFDTKLKGLPMFSPSSMVVTMPTELPSQIRSEHPVPRDQVKISVVTHSAISGELVKPEERESEEKHVTAVSVRASENQEPLEPVTVTQPQVQVTPGVFSDKFRPQTFSANRTYVESESLVVSETQADQYTTCANELTLDKKSASVTLMPKEATTVSEIDISFKEMPFESGKPPLQLKAEENFGINEGLSVLVVDEGIKEGSLKSILMPGVQPKIGLSSHEPIIVSEVFLETKPDKYVPEVIVPTETATKTVIAQQPITRDELQAPEIEGVFVPGRLPPSQQASQGVTPIETAIISTPRVEEREGDLSFPRIPQETSAVERLATVESVVVSSTFSQDSEIPFSVDTVEKKMVDVDILHQQSISTTLNTAVEKELELLQETLPNMKHALPNVSCLELSDATLPVKLESESEFVSPAAPSKAIAETSVREEESIGVTVIETSVVPAEFHEVLKYRTDEAASVVELTEAAEVWEVHLHDKEQPMKSKEQMTPASITPAYRHQFGVTVFDAQSADKEEPLRVFDLPEKHKGTVTSAHLANSLQIEEISSEDKTAELHSDAPKTETAHSATDIFVETVTQETIASEGLSAQEIPIVATKQADVLITEREAVTKTEVLSVDKESPMTMTAKPKEYFATADICGQTLPVTSEVVPEVATHDLEHEKPKHETAKHQHTTVEGVVVCQSDLAEKEGNFPKPIVPDSKTALVQITDEVSGLSITDIQAQEAESGLLLDKQPKPIYAESSVPSRETAIQSVVMSESSADEIASQLPATSRAKADHEPLSSLVITETAVSEVEREFSSNVQPSAHTASIVVGTKECFSFYEVETETKEEQFESPTAPKLRTAIPGVSGREVAMKEEFVLNQHAEDLNRISPCKETAKPEQDGLNIAMKTETATGEREGECEVSAQPKEHSAGVAYEDVPGQVLSIKEVNYGIKEGSLTTEDIPKLHKAIVDVPSNEVAQTTEVISHTDLSDLSENKPHTVRALSEQVPIETISVSLNQPVEKETELVPNLQPDNKKASSILVEEIGVNVTLNTAQDKESLLPLFEKPEGKNASTAVLARETAQTSEVVSHSTVDSFSAVVPETVQANLEHISHHPIVSTETALGELEGNLMQDYKPYPKVADIYYEEASQVQVAETYPQDKESTFLESFVPTAKFAQRAFSAHEVALNSEVQPETSIVELTIEKEKDRHAAVEQIPFETVINVQATVQEKEAQLEDIIKTTEQSATCSFETKNSLNVSQVLAEDSEEKFSPTDVPFSREAQLNIDLQEAQIISEVQSQTALGEVSLHSATFASAHTEHLPYEALSQTLPSIQETESSLDVGLQQPAKNATFEMTENLGVQVACIELQEKEDVLPETAGPLRKTAVPDVTEKETALQSQVIPATATGEFRVKKAETTTALASQQPHNYLLTTQMPVNEKEGEFSEDVLPDRRTAAEDFESSRVLVVSEEVTLAEREEHYQGISSPKERQAVPDLTEAQDIAIKSETLPEMSISEIPAESRQEEIGVLAHETLQSVAVSENHPHEVELPFDNSFERTVRNAGIGIEEAQPVQVIAEVQSGDCESSFEAWTVPKERVAVPEVSGREIAEKTEILAEMSVVPVDLLHTPAVMASSQQIPFESVLQTQAVLSEKEADFDNTQKAISSVAEMVFEEQKGIEVSEVLLEDKENHLLPSTSPKEREAHPDVTPSEAAEISAVYTQQTVGDLKLSSPTSFTARPEQGTFESIEATEPVIVEYENVLLRSDDARHTTANVALVEFDGVCVTEIGTQDREDSFIPSDTPTSKHAHAEVLAKEVALSFEVSPDFFPSEVNVEHTKAGQATFQQSVFESVTQTESIVQETENTFEKEKIPSSRNATVTLEEKSCIRVSEVLTDDKETNLETVVVPPSRIATSDIVSQEGVVTTVVDSQMHSVQKDEPFVLRYETAHTGQEPKEAIFISEGVVQEKEGTISEHERPSERNANVNFVEGNSTIVSEVIIQDKEEERTDGVKPKPTKARPEVSSRDIAEKLEIIPHSGLDVFATDKPQEARASETPLVVEALLQSQAILSERESNLELGVKERHKTARMSIDIDQTTAVSSEIIPEDKESSFASAEKPTTHNAKVDLLGRDVAEQTTVEALQTTDTIDTSEPFKGRAVVEQILFESFSQTETPVHEHERLIQTRQQPETKHADLQFQTGLSVSVLEVIPQDSEKASIDKSLPKQEMALTDVCERETALQTVTVPESNVTPFPVQSLDTSNAKATLQQPAHGVLITEIGQTGEKEADLPSLIKPSTKKIPFTIEERDSNLVVTEVHTERREELLDTFKPLPMVSAKQTTTDVLHSQATQNIQETRQDEKILQAVQKTPDMTDFSKDTESKEEVLTTKYITTHRETSKKSTDSTLTQREETQTSAEIPDINNESEHTKMSEQVTEVLEGGKKKRIKKKIVKKITADEEKVTETTTVEEEGKEAQVDVKETVRKLPKKKVRKPDIQEITDE